MLKRYISVTWAKSFAPEGGAILRQGGPHETARRAFRPSRAEILAPAPIPPSLRIVRGRRRPGRADPDPGRVQLRLAVQLQLELGDGRGRAQGRYLHDPGQLGLRRRRPGAELHAAAVAAAHRHPRRPGRVRQGGRRRRVRRSCPTSPPPSPRRPTAARPTCSISARGSSSPTARRSSPATSSGRSSGSSPCPARPRSTRAWSARTSAAPRAATCPRAWSPTTRPTP